MWHKVSQVAKTHRFNEEVFINFAAENADKFSLIAEGDSIMVNTWNADSLVEQFKRQILIPTPANLGVVN